ncbi:ABC transporter permease [Puniceicoccus vermicola]|uniref:ABC transporter permease n=1 Tax=Puniceicoccus vermicola TaxID=388746 RepID=A0A7X1B1Q8_9BACT|nr:FtsX-like permease family protein [Puniceicoccus vermicola]MBC2602865.1 ABC transporter permease [Puniceicoccus vermicola]
MSASGSSSGLPRNLFRALLHPWVWRVAWRDSRVEARRLLVFASAVITGVAALATIHGLRGSLDTGIERQSRGLLGADIQVSSRGGFSASDQEAIAAMAEEVASEVSFSTMLYWVDQDAGRLVQVRAIQGGYPFYSNIVTDPATSPDERSEGQGIFVEPALLEQFAESVGSQVRLGQAEVPVLGTITEPAPRSGRFAGIAPEVYTSEAVIEASGLLESTSLARYYLYLRLAEDADSMAIQERIRAMNPDESWRIQTPESRKERIGKVLDRFEQFLGLIALAALVLGAIGVAGAVHAQVRRRRDTIAVFRCLGVPTASAFAVFLVQACLIGGVGAILGGLFGALLHAGLILGFGAAFPVDLPTWPRLWTLVNTTFAGFAVCCGFALLPLMGIRDIPPAAALGGGESADRVGKGRRFLRALPIYLFLFAILCLLSLMNSASVGRAVQMTVALLIAFLVLTGLAWVIVRLARKIVRPSWPYEFRQGVANLYRPRNQTLLFLLSLGLGVFLILSVLLARNLLLEQIRISEAETMPNVYLVDVQPDQVDGVREVVESEGLPFLESAPMVTMRLQAVNGEPASQLREEGKLPDWVVRREYRSTYRNTLNETETTLAGTWPVEVGQGPVPVSVEEDMASDMGMQLGDTFTMNIQGVPMEARVAHLRLVDWSRFNLNFFMVFPEGVLEGAPGFHVATTRIPDGASSGGLQRVLAEQFPNVSAIDLTLILEMVREMLGRVSQAVELLAIFTLISGVSILIGALLHGREQRMQESVLLRTLGASSWQVRRILLWEYATLGFLAAIAGALLAVGGNVLLAIYAFEAEAQFFPGFVFAAVFGAIGLSVLAGSLVSRGVCNAPPLEVLRRI